jgi:short subunit dehydrogenase-like uncharacterized protein
MKTIMIYGATGFSGRLLVQKAKESGLNIILSGRNETKLKQLADQTNYEYRVFSLTDSETITKAIANVDIILNSAGPLIDNLPLFVECCIASKKHFVDLAMDPNILIKYDDQAKKNNVMILSGIGHAFLPVDCLAGFLHEKMPDAETIAIYLSGWNLISRGTAKCGIVLIKYGIHHRKNGKLVKIKNISYHRISFNDSIKTYAPSTFGVATLAFSTGIPTIESYSEVTPAMKPLLFIMKYLSWLYAFPLMQKIVEININALPEGPTEAERKSGRIDYYTEIKNRKGATLTATLTTPEAFTTTCLTTLKALENIENRLTPGFQTPCKLFGHKFINDIPGFKLTFNEKKVEN